MLRSTSSGTELFLRSLQHRFGHGGLTSRVAMMVAIGLVIIIAFSATMSVALRPRPAKNVDFRLHPAMVRLAKANITFNVIPEEKKEYKAASEPLSHRNQVIVSSFGEQENKTVSKSHDDDKLDNI